MANKLSTAAAKFWSELRRRRVIRATVAYVVVAYILVEGSTIMFPALMLPDWTVRLIVAIAILGLPLVIVLAWMFDIQVQPEGTDEPADSVSRNQHTEAETRQSYLPPNLSSEIPSVAVLPFKSLSKDEKHLLIAEGIATELHSTLAKVHRLRVASRT